MPLFRVLCRVDAYADYVAVVEADNPVEAAEAAHDNASAYEWEPQGTQEFDARLYVTLDTDGGEIEGSACGDLI